jgi:4-diphosphocytidyl-2-C-methyl-D-erythritol kinase
MICFPNAKINLGLNIIEKRPDGFHNLETIFYPIPLSDVLEILPCEVINGRKVSLEILGMDIPGSVESNLCVKVYHLLDNDFNLPPVKIILQKITPMGAGLGGGSSDGAFTLVLLNKMFNLNLTDEQLCQYASRVGSDCAFFVLNRPALGTGRGEVLSPVSLDLKGYYIVLVKPDIFVSTAEAFAGIRPVKPAIPVNDIVSKPVAQWKDLLVNDFESSIFEKHSGIKQVKDTLYANGAIYASMSGSGSSVYGVFDSEKSLKDKFPGCFYWGGWL